jgi:CheY-like chemotaxis protein
MSYPLRVLVVDDNQDAADGLTKVIRLWGHEVRSAYDETAISLMHEFQPDVVLLDVGMPHMDGPTMAPQLRANLQSSQLTIIAVTGFGEPIGGVPACQSRTARRVSREVSRSDTER